MRQSFRNAALLVFVSLLTACRWSADNELPLPDAEATGNAATAESSPDARPSTIVLSGGESGSFALTPSGTRNPQREIADPYYVVGSELGEWQLGEWANSERLSLADLRGRVVVVRFWTDEPDEVDDSIRSLQALERLKNEFAGRPVTFVGVYHSKGSLVETEWEDAVARANAARLTLPLAYDRQWTTLNQWWRRRMEHLPTTPTFVINPVGVIAHVHPGPAYFPSDRTVDRLCDADYRTLREAIQQVLPQRLADK